MTKRKLSQTRLSSTSFTTTTTAAAATAKPAFRSRKIVTTAPSPKPTTPTPPLTAPGELAAALAHLHSSSPILSPIITAHRPPTFPTPLPAFHALSRSILYQQLALPAAATIYSRFLSLCAAAVTPPTVLSLTEAQLRQIGVSSRKASYLHSLATHFDNNILSDESVIDMDDETLFTMLTAVKGIGPWTVHMFMMFTLRRPDVLPVGDLSIRKGVQKLYGLKEVPSPAKVEELCEHWRPYRSVGSWYMYRLIEDKGVPAMVVLPLPRGVSGDGDEDAGVEQTVLEVTSF